MRRVTIPAYGHAIDDGLRFQPGCGGRENGDANPLRLQGDCKPQQEVPGDIAREAGERMREPQRM